MTAESEDGASPEPEDGLPAKKRRASGDRVPGPKSKGGRPIPRRRIVVEGEVSNVAAVDREKIRDQAESSLPSEEGGLVLMPSPSSNGAIINFPTKEQFALIIAQADTPEKLVRLRNMVAARNAAAKHMRASAEQMVQFAVLQLRVDRTIGHELAQHVRPGPVAKWSSKSTNTKRESESTRLPDDISKNESSAYQKLAAAPEAVFEDFLALAVKRNKPPTITGALKYAAKASGKASTKPRRLRKPTAQSAVPALSAALLDAVQRCMRDIDVCIGDAKVKCATRLKVDTASTKQIRGRVFVSECRDPGEELPKLAKLRMTGAIEEALVVLPHDTGAAWFKALAEGEWHCCFPTGGGALVAYLGPKTRGFVVTFGQVGTVVCGCAGAEPEP